MGDCLSARLQGLPHSLDGLSGWPGGEPTGPGHYGSQSQLLTTAIRHVSWVNGPYLTMGFSPGTLSGFLPQ